jgi:hypothetical protein
MTKLRMKTIAPGVAAFGMLGCDKPTQPQANNPAQPQTAPAAVTPSLPTSASNPVGITQGPDGALWFTEYAANRIGQVITVTAAVTVSPASGFYRTNLTFNGSSFGPNESITIYTKGIGSPTLVTATADSTGSFTTTPVSHSCPMDPRVS